MSSIESGPESGPEVGPENGPQDDLKVIVEGIKTISPPQNAAEVSLRLLTFLQVILWEVGHLKTDLSVAAVGRLEAELADKITRLRDALLG